MALFVTGTVAWRGKLVSSNNATYGHDALRPGIVVGPIGLSAALFPVPVIVDRSFMGGDAAFVFRYRSDWSPRAVSALVKHPG